MTMLKNTIVRSHEHMHNTVMPMSIHLPRALLVEIERRAKVLKVSSNRLIVSVLENEFKRRTDWSESFKKRFGSLAADGDAFATKLEAVVRTRRSKRPIEF